MFYQQTIVCFDTIIDMEKYYCKFCSSEQNADQYRVVLDKKGSPYRLKRCIPCEKQRANQNYADSKGGLKKCPHCKTKKPKTESFRLLKSNYYTKYCIECLDKLSRINKKSKLKNKYKEPDLNQAKEFLSKLKKIGYLDLENMGELFLVHENLFKDTRKVTKDPMVAIDDIIKLLKEKYEK